ncbi:hypothetical protein AB0C32_39180, partial [Streptosporangium sp. NPDC048865]
MLTDFFERVISVVTGAGGGERPGPPGRTRAPGLRTRLRELAPDGIDVVIDTFGGGYVDLAIA